MAAKSGRPSKRKIRLIQSDKRDVRVQLKPGMRFEVTEVSVVDADLKKPTKVGARLCGMGTNVCLALIDIESDV